jgi:hypothetical protein
MQDGGEMLRELKLTPIQGLPNGPIFYTGLHDVDVMKT